MATPPDAVAQRPLGDLLVLADELPGDASSARANAHIGMRLLAREKHAWAMTRFEAALAFDPADAAALAGKASCLAAAGDDPQAVASIGARPEDVLALQRSIVAQRRIDAARFLPRRVLLFSGHRVDAPGREPPRLPQARLTAAAASIGRALDALGVGPGDLSLSQAASGGDLLFLEACAERGVHRSVLLPFDQAQFVERSVADGAQPEAWRQRYAAAVSALAVPPRGMPVALGPLPPGVDAYERCNAWLLSTALAEATAAVDFICLWDGGGQGDGPGGTAHLVREIRRHGGALTWIDTRRL